MNWYTVVLYIPYTYYIYTIYYTYTIYILDFRICILYCWSLNTDPLDLGGVAILEDLVEVVQHLLDLAVCERRRKATGFGSGDMAVRLQYGTLSSRSATALSGRASDVPGASGRHAPRLATLATWRVGTAVRSRRQPARH